jgi:hypothetical protein
MEMNSPSITATPASVIINRRRPTRAMSRRLIAHVTTAPFPTDHFRQVEVSINMPFFPAGVLSSTGVRRLAETGGAFEE